MGSDIDWSKHGDVVSSTVYCRCDCAFRSHGKWTPDRGIVSKSPCPKCGNTEGHRRISYDPETYSLATDDIDQGGDRG